MSETSTTRRPKRIVLTTFGSLGDLHPFVAIALGLQARGHEAILATSACYQQKIEALGIGFRAVAPDSDWVSDARRMHRFMDPRLGLLRLAREVVLPALRDSYDDLLAAVHGTNLLVSPQFTLAARLVAEKTGITWASSIHIPMFFFSAYDLSVLPVAPILSRQLHCLGRTFWDPLIWFAKRATRPVAKPWYRFRTELGLPATSETNPLLDSHSPALVLAMFSRLLADKQPDWPPQTVITGFPVFDQNGQAALPTELTQFLDDGPPPIIFTLGTAVSANAGSFFEHSARAATLLGRRAVLIHKDPRNRIATLPPGVMACEYARFSELFPRAAAIVHHGGIGSTGLAMRAGRPTLVMPCAWDQPDNAERAKRLGIARSILPRHYTPERVAAELRELLDNPTYSQRALAVADLMQNEDGVQSACDALEALLYKDRQLPPGG